MTTLYDRLEALLNDLLNNEVDIRSAERMIEQAFSDSFINEENIDEAYFQEARTDIYLKDSNGLSISFISGKGDIMGDTHSNIGSTISLQDIRTNETYELYSDNEFQRQIVSKLVENLPQITTDREKFISNWNIKQSDPFYLYTMDKNDIQQNPEIVKQLLDELWYDANVKYKHEYEYDRISPFGGEDVIVHPTTEHFLNLTFKLRDYLDIDAAIKEYLLSKPESIEFLNKAIKDLKKKICYAENVESYTKINNLQKQYDDIDNDRAWNDMMLEKTEKELKKNKKDYQKALAAKEALGDKNYTLLDKFKGTQNENLQKAQSEVDRTKEVLDTALAKKQNLDEAIQDFSMKLETITEKIEEIKVKNNIPTLYMNDPLSEWTGFDNLMYRYSLQYEDNKRTLERYQSILGGDKSKGIEVVNGVKKNIEVAKDKQIKSKNPIKKSIEKNIKL